MVFVKLTKCNGLSILPSCVLTKIPKTNAAKRLQEVVELIQLVVLERFQGTNIRENFISHRSIKMSRDLEDLTSFTKDDIMRAEENENGFFKFHGDPEQLTDILLQGYDTMLLQEFGSEYRFSGFQQRP